MTLRFRKSFKVAPGLRLTLGKRTASLRVGGPRAGLSAGTTGRRSVGASLGHGLSVLRRLR